MLTKLRVTNGIKKDNEITFLITEKMDGKIGTPSGKMITDSEAHSFVYLLDEEEGYSQLHFPQDVWPIMAASLLMSSDPILSHEDQMIKLTGFKEELTMLIFNIEGNHNYGETFSKAVEEAFAEHLTMAE